LDPTRASNSAFNTTWLNSDREGVENSASQAGFEMLAGDREVAGGVCHVSALL